MKNKIFTISIFFLCLQISLCAQSNEAFQFKHDSIQNEIEKIDNKILILKKNKETLSLNLLKLSEDKIKKEFEENISSGIELKTSFSGGSLKDAPNRKGNTIIKIPGNETIIVYDVDFESLYFKAKYEDKIGYINEIFLSLTDELKLMKQKSIKRDPKRERLVRMFGKRDAEAITYHRYWIGMTNAMAIESLGKPDDINNSTGSWGEHSQWIYENKKLYLYFENGKLSSFQD